MDHAHQAHIVHRDLKPANILITEEGVPKILDLGLAMLLGEPMHDGLTTTAGAVVGTPAFMAPEQLRGEMRMIGPQADVYSLGVILYEMLVGRRPFKGSRSVRDLMEQVLQEKPDPPSRWRPGLPRDLDAICLKCLEKDAKHRYATAAALADDLDHFLAGNPIMARPQTLIERLLRLNPFRRPPRRRHSP